MRLFGNFKAFLALKSKRRIRKYRIQNPENAVKPYRPLQCSKIALCRNGGFLSHRGTSKSSSTWLVVWNLFCFSIYWEESSQLTFIFFGGVQTTNQPLIAGIFQNLPANWAMGVSHGRPLRLRKPSNSHGRPLAEKMSHVIGWLCLFCGCTRSRWVCS